MSVWDDPELRAGGEFAKFDEVGDEVSGTIAAIRKHSFDNGQVAPQVLLTTDAGEERTVTAGQTLLKRELAEQRPEAGDWVQIKLTQIEPRAGGKSLKHFTVKVRRGGNGQTPAATSAQSTPAATASEAAPADPNVSAEALAALKALSPEQRAALGL